MLEFLGRLGLKASRLAVECTSRSMPPHVRFKSTTSHQCDYSDKLDRLQVRLRQYRTANRAQAQEIAYLKGPDMPCVALGIPLCAGCKDFAGQAGLEKMLVQVLEDSTEDLEDLRDSDSVERHDRNFERHRLQSSIKTLTQYLGHVPAQLEAHHTFVRFDLLTN